jgi:hypothetical protein
MIQINMDVSARCIKLCKLVCENDEVTVQQYSAYSNRTGFSGVILAS